MVVLFKADKSLNITSLSTIIQNENLADVLYFYVPTTYEENDLSLFNVYLWYENVGCSMSSERLTASESDKDGYLKYTVDITSSLTKLCGNVKIWLSFERSTESSDGSTTTVSRILSKETVFHILKSSNMSYDLNVESKLDDLESKLDTLTSLVEQLIPSTSDESTSDTSTDGE